MAQRHAACKQEEEACFQQSISNHYEDYEETFTKTFWAASVYHRVLGSTLFILCEVSHRMTIDWVINTRAIIFLIFLPAGRYYSCQWLIWALCVSNLCVCMRACMHAYGCMEVWGWEVHAYVCLWNPKDNLECYSSETVHLVVVLFVIFFFFFFFLKQHLTLWFCVTWNSLCRQAGFRLTEIALPLSAECWD